ncbi:hypothetical protein CR513_23059, partial [Mucuna pruriens]
ELYNLKQGDTFMTKCFIIMKTLWDELEILKLVSICICNANCTCGISQNVEERQFHAQHISDAKILLNMVELGVLDSRKLTS